MKAILQATMLVLAATMPAADVAGAEPGAAAQTGGASVSSTLCAQSPDCVRLSARPEIANAMELAKAEFDRVIAAFQVDPTVIKSALKESQGFAVLPDIVKSGFIDAQIHGQGFLVFRLRNGHWGPPLMLEVDGTSLGPQMGTRISDALVVFKTKKSLNELLTGKPMKVVVTQGDSFLYGGSEAADQPSGIVSYVVSRGMVLGQSTGEIHVRLRDQANLKLYGKHLKAGEIFEVEELGLRVPAPITMFVDHINERIDTLPPAKELKTGGPMPQPQAQPQQ
jgi:lipid-binding SYLF domain-containing protein